MDDKHENSRQPIHMLVSSLCLVKSNLFLFSSSTRSLRTEIPIDRVDGDKLYVKKQMGDSRLVIQ